MQLHIANLLVVAFKISKQSGHIAYIKNCDGVVAPS